MALSIVGLGYVLYMLLVDIPRHAGRWFADEAAGVQYLSLLEGLRDIVRPHAVTYAFEAWRHEFVWMSLYFSVGVWTSIALIYSPLPERRPMVLPQVTRRGRLDTAPDPA